jgi:hypothetical protein
MEKYRELAQKFYLDREEFRKLGTLASQEKVLISLKDVMLARTHVQQTYLDALEALLLPLQGIDIAQKQIALEAIASSRSYLLGQRNKISTLSDKDDLLEASATYELENEQVIDAQYRTLSLITLGRMQSTYDQLVVSTNNFKTEFVDPIPDSGKKAVKERGLKEVGLLLTQTDEALRTGVTQFSAINLPQSNNRKADTKSIYSQVSSTLEPAFTTMKRTITFLKELDRQL